jgi:hypothetical protein
MAMSQYGFATSDGSGREYTAQSYGTSVGSGGTRRGGIGGMRDRAVGAVKAQQGGGMGAMQGNPASVALDAPRIPNLAPLDAGGGGPRGGGSQPSSYAPRLEGQVKAYGDMVGQDFTKKVGSMLGDLNGIGALRSGAAQTGLNDLTTEYGRQIGNYASQTATDAAKLDQQESEFGRNLGFQRDQFGEQQREFDSSDAFRKSEAARDETDKSFERNFITNQYNDQKKASQRRGIGKVLGGIAGVASSFVPGGSVAGKVLGGLGKIF